MQDHLQTRRDERAALLQRAITLCEEDQRVGAAWLIGSEGRGGADALSDIDLWTVVDDEHVEAFRAGQRAFMARLGTPLLIADAAGLGPRGGGFLLVLFASAEGALHLDWRWQPRSTAQLPGASARLIFDRVGLPPAPDTSTRTDQERAIAAAEHVTGIWITGAIVVKAIVRGQPWGALGRLAVMRWQIEQLEALLEGRATMPDVPRYTDTPPVGVADQLALLRALCGKMEALMPRVEALGADVPRDAVPQIYRFFDLAAATIEDQPQGHDS